MTGLDFFRMIHSLAGHVREKAMRVVVLLASGADRAAVSARLPEGIVLVDPPVDGAELATLVWGLLRHPARVAVAGVGVVPLPAAQAQAAAR